MGFAAVIKKLHAVIELYARREEVKGKSRCVSISEISNNDFNLNVSRYIHQPIEEDLEPLYLLLNKQKKLEEELIELQREMKGIVDCIS
ncbi:MAG: N-6 DNA methylase [Endozoicomonas sp.]|uniref:N-6 DNA methylase n=1 Tax=Endozoicomonas sp. TaxID=1892382 RepID=UPI003D9B672D